MTARISAARRTPLQALRAAAAPLAKTALLRTGGYAAIRRLFPSGSLAILRYHAICGPEGYRYADPAICISPDSFEQHVAYLTREYTVLRLEDAARRIAARQPLPRNAVVITFDDGYADNLVAARTLHKYGATATFYITAGCLAGGQPFWPAELRHLLNSITAPRVAVHSGPVSLELDVTDAVARAAAVKRLTKTFKSHPITVREELRQQLRELAQASEMHRVMLTWDEVREMRALGMTIGSHTMTHPNLPSAGVSAATQEITDSKARLERELDEAVTMFSYPNGGAERYCTPELQRVVAEAGFTAAVTSRNAFAGATSNVYSLERIEVEERLEDLVFALELERFILQPAPRQGEMP